MPNQEYIITMAKYNLWQNENLITAASTLSCKERQLERGAFFGSIDKTFAHILWGDRLWLSRFAKSPPPSGGIDKSVNLTSDWGNFKADRADFDHQILTWAKAVPAEWFVGDLSWFSGAINQDITKPKSMLVLQFFNHQTHHRGQIHAMLTAAGAKPGDTDVPFMPDTFLDM